jgi:Tfp pilus assembly PilM family ATPase/DNA uptake protein ComE-like DNA-binding protein
MWVGLVAGLILLGVQKGLRTNLATARTELASVQAHWLARAGVETVIAVLSDDDLASDGAWDAWYDDPGAFEDVELTGGTFSVTAPQGHLGDPREVRHGLVDHGGRLNLNVADAKALKTVGGLTDRQIDAFLDWRDGDNKVRAAGAEKLYYGGIDLPYRIRNGPLQTVGELLLVRGIGPDTFAGEDADLNGVLDPNEDDMSVSPPDDNGDGRLDRGLGGLATIWSYELNRDAFGGKRTNVNSADKKTLMESFNFTDALAEAVTSSGGGGRGKGGRGGRAGGGAKQPSKRFSSLMDLLKVQPKGKASGKGDQEGKVSKITLKWLAEHLDELTLTDEDRLPGRINVNTASPEVLRSLPKMDAKALEAICRRQNSGEGPFTSVGELLTSRIADQPDSQPGAVQGGCGARQRPQQRVRDPQHGPDAMGHPAADRGRGGPRVRARDHPVLATERVMSETTHDVAWGVEFGGSAVRLVRLTRTERGYRADEYVEAAVADRWEAPPDPGRAAAGLTGRAGAGPVAAAVADELVLFRSLSLPEAGPEDMDKMVRGQVEVLVPAQADRFVSGWRAWPDPDRPGHQRVLLCAARREVVAPTTEACRRLGAEPEAVVPSILALAALWTGMAGGSGRPVVLVDVAARCTALAVVDGSEVLCCGVTDHGADRWTERIAEELNLPCAQAEARKHDLSAASGQDPAGAEALRHALTEWARSLREAYRDCIADLAEDRRPSTCVLFGRSARMPGLAERVTEALGVQAKPARQTDRLSLAEGLDFSRSAAAIGAAMCAMNADSPAASLSAHARQAPTGSRPRISRRWAALVAWLLAAVLGMYCLDRVEAARGDRALKEARARTNRPYPLSRQLAIGRHLETSGPTALDVLDRISRNVPKKVMLTSWRYGRNGDAADVALTGTAPNEKEFLTVLEKLCEIGEVEWKTGRPDKGKFRFEVQLKVGRRDKARMAKAPPAAKGEGGPATAPTTKSGGASATKPATAPSSRRRPGGAS